MGGHYHNGVADNAIKNVVRIYRTMMNHTELRWRDASEKRLWTMDMAHAVHLYNHITHISSGMPPSEVWTKYKFYNSALQEAHPWR